MNVFSKISLKARCKILSIVTIVLTLLLGFSGVIDLNKANKEFKARVIYEQPVTENSIPIIREILNVRLEILKSNDNLNSGNFDKAISDIDAAYQKAKKALESYIKMLEAYPDNSQDDIITLTKEIHTLLDEYYSKTIQNIKYLKEGNNQQFQSQTNEIVKIIDSLLEKVFALPTNTFDSMISSLDDVSKGMSFLRIGLIILTILMAVFVFVFTTLLSSSITKPIEKIKSAAHKVLAGDLDIDIRTNNTDELGDLSNTIANMSGTIQCIIDDINDLSNHLEEGNTSYRINTNKYRGAFNDATNSINIAINNLVNDSLYVAENIKEIEKGNFEREIIKLKGDKDVSTQALRNIQETLKIVSFEINALINSAIDGKLDYKIDTSKYSGTWKESVEGLNLFTQTIFEPIKDTQNALNEFSKGNFSHRITNEYKGEFNNIKQNVNYTAETIGSYISEISKILNEMAHKDFTGSIDKEYVGDFKAIQKSVTLILKNLNDLTKGIITSAEKVSSGARQISESSISLAEGATEQAEAVEKLNYVIRDISEQTMENARSSKDANNLAIETRENATKGSHQMNNMLKAMEEINIASNSISNIIKVIEDIAFQTNILALNAAVEAARAGEHGKGFAVVAEEVRNLAARSQQAAKETTELIESSVEKVEEGSKIANQTANALLQIVDQIQSISTLVETCAKSSTEQEMSISEVLNAISKISTVTQNNTATSEESAAASEQLANQAEIFHASVADFKLKEDDILKTNPKLDIKKSKKDEPIKKPAKNLTKNSTFGDIDLSSDDMIILDDSLEDIVIEDLDFGKY